jgi:hypothetical protein
MIALTDSGLAHLAIAATAVAPKARRRWLAALAEEIDPDTSPAGRRRARDRAKWRNWYRESQAGVFTPRPKCDALI